MLSQHTNNVSISTLQALTKRDTLTIRLCKLRCVKSIKGFFKINVRAALFGIIPNNAARTFKIKTI